MNPAVLAGLAGLVVVVLLVDCALRARRVARRELPVALGLAGLSWRAGILLALGGGFASWLLGLQGFVVLTEGVSLPVAGGTHLQGFEAGPLANTAELGHFLKLEKLDLEPRGPSSFSPVSHLSYDAPGHPVWKSRVEVGHPAFLGALRFQQGTFGFSPRVVVLQGDREVFDAAVPFTTSRGVGRSLAFDGSFRLEKERLLLEGTVSLDELDERMKGHPNLVLKVSRDGVTLGQGNLTPGQFADLEGGYRVGFAGLKHWSEIDVSRNTSPAPIFAGAGLFLLGALAHLGAWAASRRRA